ncbi:MAG: hypothetical protein ACOWWR_16580 [Eubacteriales bacterium]
MLVRESYQLGMKVTIEMDIRAGKRLSLLSNSHLRIGGTGFEPVTSTMSR